MNTVKKILAPVDFSACATQACKRALGLAEQLNATVDIVHFFEAPSMVSEGLIIQLPNRPRTTIEEGVKLEAANSMEKFMSELGAVDSERVQTKLIRGRALDELLKLTKTGAYDMVVMGMHGRSRLERWMLGSLTERLLRSVKLPVLVIGD